VAVEVPKRFISVLLIFKRSTTACDCRNGDSPAVEDGNYIFKHKCIKGCSNGFEPKGVIMKVTYTKLSIDRCWSYCCLLLMVFTLVTIHADTLIAPTDEGINYYGRFDFSTPARPKCNWSGAIIEASFPGPTIGMRLEYNDAYYDIEIDGVRDTIISTKSAKDFIFRNDLSPQNHTVRIVLRSENHYSAGTFFGLYLANGKVLSTPPERPTRKIEFIGDSYTAGYGIESPSRDCGGQLQKYTNANLTFAALVTKAFHAQSIILGWSGAGMVRNYGEGGKRSSAPFPAHYSQTLGETGESQNWDFSKWVPELVVICLGTNDYSTTPHPDDSMYIGDYHKFISRILGNYPDASLLCVSTGDATFEKNVRTVVAEEVTARNHPKVYFAPYPKAMENTGCDWHPSISDNVNVAEVLIDTIMKKLSWDTSASVAAVYPHLPGKSGRNTVKVSGRMVNGRFDITLAGKRDAAVPILLFSMQGELVDRTVTGAGNSCSFKMDGRSPGVYIAGNPAAGWVRAMVRR
jgi:lysophospholipase L1-like esterase